MVEVVFYVDRIAFSGDFRNDYKERGDFFDFSIGKKSTLIHEQCLGHWVL